MARAAAVTGHVVHRARGRLRLRFPQHKGQAAALAALEQQLRQSPLVTATRSNPLTGSLLVLHHGEGEAVEDHVRSLGVALQDGAQGPEEGLQIARDRLRDLDHRLRERSGGRWGLRSIAFASLVAGGTLQALRGNPLPAGATLLIQAFKLLEDLDERPRPKPPRRG